MSPAAPYPPNQGRRAVFIELQVIEERCVREPGCRECVQSCPVDIFARQDQGPALVIEENQDECILCDLCLERCPVQAVVLRKLY